MNVRRLFVLLNRQSQKQARYLWAIADQVINSAGNLILTSQLSRALGPVKFGPVATAYIILLIFVPVGRAIFSEVINSKASSERERVEGDRAVRVLTYLIAAIAMVCSLGVGALRHFDVVSLIFIAFGILLVQDRFRIEWIYRNQTSRAFLIDFVWLFVQLVSLATFSSVVSPSPRAAVVAWLAGAVISLAFFRRLRGRLSFRHSFAWAREHVHASLATSAQSLIVNTTAFGPVFIFGAVGKPAWAAGYVAASSALGLQSSTLNAVRPLIFRSLADQRGAASFSDISRRAGALALLGGVVGGASYIGLVLFGTRIFGTTAHISIIVGAWIALTRSVGGASSVFNGALRSRGAWGTTLVGEALTAIEMLAIMVIAAFAISVRWVSPAQTFGAVISLAIWVALFRKDQRRSIDPVLPSS